MAFRPLYLESVQSVYISKWLVTIWPSVNVVMKYLDKYVLYFISFVFMYHKFSDRPTQSILNKWEGNFLHEMSSLQNAVQPPSTMRLTPVTNWLARSEARKSAAPATSEGRPNRGTAVLALLRTLKHDAFTCYLIFKEKGAVARLH